MTSIHRLLSNDRNAIATADLTANSVLPATNTISQTVIARTGSATALLTGGYTGANDCTIDVAITSATGTSLLSTPVFTGVGNGVLSDLTLTTNTSKSVTITLADTGTITKPAELEFFGVTLVANATGTAGNGFTLTVDDSAITKVETAWSFLEEAKEGANEFKGDEWSFGAYALTSDGELNKQSPRLRFGDDPQTYRQYKVYQDQAWVYVVDPPLVRDVLAETKVYTITGNYTVLITDGAETNPVQEYYTCASLFDFLKEVNSKSKLVTVKGVIVEDRTPGGMAVEDMPARTNAYALPAVCSGSKALKGVQDIVIDSEAPTEVLTVTCKNADVVNSEQWEVKGSISGELADIETNRVYESGHYQFFIPPVSTSITTAEKSRIRVKDLTLQMSDESTEEGKGAQLCIDPLMAGAKASAKEIKVLLKAKPPIDCLCENAPVTNDLNLKCLGLAVSEGGGGMTIDANYQTRLQWLYNWRAEFMRDNSVISDTSVIATAFYDMELCDKITNEFSSCLSEVYSSADARDEWDDALEEMQADVLGLASIGKNPFPEYAPDIWYKVGDVIQAPNKAGYVYECVSITADAEMYDVREYESVGSGEYNFAYIDSNGTQYTENQIPSDSYLVTKEVNLTSAVLTYDENDPDPNPSPFTDTQQSGSIHINGADGVYIYNRPIGIHESGDPDSGTGNKYPIYQTDSVTASGVVAHFNLRAVKPTEFSDDIQTDVNSGALRQSIEQFVRRYQAKMDFIRTLAGIVPKGKAGSQGTECWQEIDKDPLFWEVNGGEYLPAYFNTPYHSCIRAMDLKTKEQVILSTQEFGFIIRCACPDRLKEGSSFTIVIDGAAEPSKVYQIGDEIKIPIVEASPLVFDGGVNGNDTLKWSIRDSIVGTSYDDYSAPIGNETVYNKHGLTFKIAQGKIPFALGDKFEFATAGGLWKWRKDDAAWSNAAAIGTTPTVLTNGLSLTFTAGASPAYAVGDKWLFTVKQPHSPELLKLPNRKAWRWTGATAQLDCVLATATTITAIALWHSIPANATITLKGLDEDDEIVWTKSLTWRQNLIVALFEGDDAVAECASLRINLTNATGGAIKWLWTGTPFIPSACASSCTLNVSHSMIRGVESARWIGSGGGGELEWNPSNNSWLEQADLDALLAMVDHVKQNNDQPIVFIPNKDYPAESRLVKINTDSIDISDLYQFQYTPQRVISARIPFAAVIQ